jgi:methionyl aminopeptidase
LGVYIYNSEQISGIERACLVAAGVLDALEGMIAEGVTTFELDKIAREFIAARKGSPAFLGYRGYPAALCTSINEVVVHGIPSKKTRLRAGDIIGVDVGVFLDGFYGDTARTYAVGDISQEAKTLMAATEESLMKGIERAVPGRRISDISHAVEEHVAGYGFVPVRDFVGHGIGASLHEEPSIPNFGKPGKGPRIADGMVLAIEPMINAGTCEVEVLDDGWTAVTADRRLSAHYEHTIAVMDGSPRILTRRRDGEQS